MTYKITLKLDQIMPLTIELETNGDIVECLVEKLLANDREVLKQMVAKKGQLGLEANIFKDGKHYGEKYILLESNGYRVNDLEEEDE